MCGGAEYTYKNPETQLVETRKVYFPQPFAKMPVFGDGGAVELLQWGKREGEDSEIPVPQTGWARESSLNSDYWQRYEPKSVLVPVLRFSEKGKLNKSRWFDMTAHTYLRGLRIDRPEKSFVYIVTNPAIGELAKVHDRMPLVVTEDFTPVVSVIPLLEEEPQEGQMKLF